MQLSSISSVLFASLTISVASLSFAADYSMVPTKEDQVWLLPETPPHPSDNKPTAERVELGKKLFFDTRLSSDRNMSCASCHSPMFGWSDGLATARGNKSKLLGRASPTITNTAFNSIQMWDGRKKDLEDQAMGPMQSMDEMAMNMASLFDFLKTNPVYMADFAKAYPGEEINEKTTAKAIASYERTIISNNSPFDRWIKGEKNAMTTQQIRGFRLFADAKKGNCVQCHSAPNFTDNGFHNIGLASYGKDNPDVGRFAIKPLPSLKGAFKTPTMRDVTTTAPYFHDGSAKNLTQVVEHYNNGGAVQKDLSGNIKPLNLSKDEVANIVAFMQALTSPQQPLTLPTLPLE